MCEGRAKGVAHFLRKNASIYRLVVGSSVIENLTPEESLDLVLRVIQSDLDDGDLASVVLGGELGAK